MEEVETLIPALVGDVFYFFLQRVPSSSFFLLLLFLRLLPFFRPLSILSPVSNSSPSFCRAHLLSFPLPSGKSRAIYKKKKIISLFLSFFFFYPLLYFFSLCLCLIFLPGLNKDDAQMSGRRPALHFTPAFLSPSLVSHRLLF